MKILYISPYLGFSGYSTAARGYVKALHDAGVDIVLRNVKYDAGREYQLQEWDRGLFTKAAKDIDIIIQHLTPNEMSFKDNDPNVKHVAIVATETTSVAQEWVREINKMDALITFCDMSVQCFKDSGVQIPIYKVPHCFDMSQYQVRPDSLIAGSDSPINLSGDDKPLIFYNISQWSNKKGIDLALRAYFRAFQNNENVLLLTKGYIGMVSRQGEEEKLQQIIDTIKQKSKLPQYPKVCLVTDVLDDSEVQRIHGTGDVYLNTSHGEAWGIPMFEAAAYGNAVVTHMWGGQTEYLLNDEIYVADHVVEPVYDASHPFPYMYTGLENWSTPTVPSVVHALQKAYTDYQNNALKRSHSKVHHFDHSTVGPAMKAILEEVMTRDVVGV